MLKIDKNSFRHNNLDFSPKKREAAVPVARIIKENKKAAADPDTINTTIVMKSAKNNIGAVLYNICMFEYVLSDFINDKGFYIQFLITKIDKLYLTK